jgi:thiol-disulfide isomerase/thioredoxin
MKLTLQFSTLFLALLLLGCGDEKTPDDQNGESASSHAEPEPEDLGPPLPGEPTVEVWNWEETLEAVKKHQGQVVVLHIWASWNEDLDDPANEGPEDRRRQMELLGRYGFDQFVRMKKLHRDDVVAISLNTDYNYDNQDQPPESHTEKVLDFVTEHGANFQHGISSVLEGDLQDQLEIIGTPATLVFDKKGELRHKFSLPLDEDEEAYSYKEDVIPKVLELVKEEYTASVPKAEEVNPEEQPEKDESVHVEIRDWNGLQKMVADAKRKVVVVDLWSTQCEPCLKEYPNLVKLHNERSGDVACISFNMDYTGKGNPEDLKETVLEVLKLQKSNLPNVMSSEGDEKIYAKIEAYAIPVVQVYDREGKLRKQFDESLGEFTYAKDVLPFVETLIQEK